MTQYQKIFDAIMERIDKNPNNLEFKLFEDAFSAVRADSSETGTKDLQLSERLKKSITSTLPKAPIIASDLYALYWRVMCWEATDSFDSFILYMEHKRPREKQFYLPRRKQLKPLVEALEKLERRELHMLGLSLPPGVGKTTLAEFFLTWTGGRHPDKPNLTGSHSNAFLRGLYGELLRFLDPSGDYCWSDVFPGLKVIQTNAQDMLIDLGENKSKAKRFCTFMLSSVGSGNAGKVRAENLLYCDDLVDGLESALSRERMDKLYNLYAVDLRQRKVGNYTAELHIATRWSVHDVLGRLEQLYADDPKAMFIKVPAVDENDESNFNYDYGVGYTTEMLHQQREAMDDASWRALFLNEPIEREGQLYPESNLRRYFDLPDYEPDAIIAVCDTKDRGDDYCVMPIAYQYGTDYYIDTVICDNSAPDVVDARLIAILLDRGVQMARFESNSAGGRIAEKVRNEVKARGGITKITTKYTTANKETKIIMAQPFVQEHFLFRDNSVIREDKEYRTFMKMLTGYTLTGKNKHDDVPDAIAMLSDYAQSFSIRSVELLKRFW